MANFNKFDPRLPHHRSIFNNKKASLLAHFQGCFPESGLFTFWGDISDTPNSATNVVSNLVGTVLEPLILYSKDALHKFLPESAVTDNVVTEEMCTAFVSDQTLSPDTAACVERSTRGQAKNGIWHLLRNGRITSSRFGEILHRKASTSGDRLVAEITGYTEDKVRAMPAVR